MLRYRGRIAQLRQARHANRTMTKQIIVSAGNIIMTEQEFCQEVYA